jgi:hypothetical protein
MSDMNDAEPAGALSSRERMEAFLATMWSAVTEKIQEGNLGADFSSGV